MSLRAARRPATATQRLTPSRMASRLRLNSFISFRLMLGTCHEFVVRLEVIIQAVILLLQNLVFESLQDETRWGEFALKHIVETRTRANRDALVRMVEDEIVVGTAFGSAGDFDSFRNAREQWFEILFGGEATQQQPRRVEIEERSVVDRLASADLVLGARWRPLQVIPVPGPDNRRALWLQYIGPNVYQSRRSVGEFNRVLFPRRRLVAVEIIDFGAKQVGHQDRRRLIRHCVVPIFDRAVAGYYEDTATLDERVHLFREHRVHQDQAGAKDDLVPAEVSSQTDKVDVVLQLGCCLKEAHELSTYVDFASEILVFIDPFVVIVFDNRNIGIEGRAHNLLADAGDFLAFLFELLISPSRNVVLIQHAEPV